MRTTVIVHKNNKRDTEAWLRRLQHKIANGTLYSSLEKYAIAGMDELITATPKDTGRLSDSWAYEIEVTKTGAVIRWTNNDIEGGASVALLVQYGHGLKDGSYIEGIDFINPAMKPVFDDLADSVWREVIKA